MFAVSHHHTDKGVRSILTKREQERREAAARQEAEIRQRQLKQARHLAEMRQQRIERAQELIREFSVVKPCFRHTYALIEKRASRVFCISIPALRGERRDRKTAFARQFVMYWTIRLTGLSFPQVGRLMGGRDHTTILHGAKIYPEKRAYMGRKLKSAR